MARKQVKLRTRPRFELKVADLHARTVRKPGLIGALVAELG